MNKKTKNILYPLITIAVTGAISAGITYAVFAATDNVQQPVRHTEGEVKKSIFLDCDEIWNLGYGEIYYAYVFKYNDGNPATVYKYLEPSRTVTYEHLVIDSAEPISRDLYVFEYDSTKYDRIIFIRESPDSVALNSSSSQRCETGDSSWWNDYLWGRTTDITYSSSINYYHIDGYYTDSEYCSYSYGTLEPDGDVTISGSYNVAP